VNTVWQKHPLFVWLAALYWLVVFLISLAICRRPVAAAMTTIGGMVGCLLIVWL
jgi:hypothetical protein